MAKPFQFRLRTLLLAVVPVAVAALPLGLYLRRPAPPQPVAATGTITLDGLPLDGATVIFHPVVGSAGGRSALGNTDMTGRFRLMVDMGGPPYVTGAVPGSYKIIIEKSTITGGNGPFRDARTGKKIKLKPGEEWWGQATHDEPFVVNYITPEKYAHLDTSDLTADVTPNGPNVFTFNLTTP